MANRKRKPGGNPARPAASTRLPPRAQPRKAGGQRQPPVATEESALRVWVANHSKRGVIILSAQPKLLLPGVMVVLVLAGLAAPVPIAVVALALVAAFISWLAFLSWPVLEPRLRVMRVAVIVVIIGVAVARITGLLA